MPQARATHQPLTDSAMAKDPPPQKSAPATQIIARDDDARDEAQCTHDAARHAPVAVKVRL